MIEVVRGTGWKKDLPAFADMVEPASRLLMQSKFGAAPLPRTSNGYLSKLAYIRDQFNSSACTGFSKTGAAHTRLRAVGYDVEIFSPAFDYAGARMIAKPKSRAMIDDGAYPFMSMMFSQRFGMLAEQFMRFDLKNINTEPNVDDFQRASQFRLSHCRRIDLPHLRIEYIKRSIHNLCPVWLGLQVGGEFQRWQPGNDPVGVEFANVSGHMVYVTDYDDEKQCFLMPNSWGKKVGKNGFWEISYEKIEHESTSDIYEIQLTDMPMTESQITAWNDIMSRFQEAA